MGLKQPIPKITEKAIESLTISAPPEPDLVQPAASGESETLPLSEAEFENELGRLLATQTPAVAGRIHVINLCKLRDRFGERWSEIAWNVDALVRKVIKQNLTPGDVFTRHHDYAYFLLLPHLSKAEGQLKCVLIAERVLKRLAGEEALGFVDVRTAVTQVDGSVGFEEVRRTERLATLLDRAEEQKQPRLLTASDPSPTTWKDLRFIYRPMWNVRKRLVSTYLCVPVLQSPEGPTLLGEAVLPQGDTLARSSLDLTILEHVLDDLRGVSGKGQRMILAVPLHYGNVVNSGVRRELVKLCQTFTAAHQYLVFEIVGVPSEADRRGLQAMLAFLQPYSRALIARLPLECTDFPLFDETGVIAAGVDIGEVEGTEARIIAKMDVFAACAAQAGLRSYIHGLTKLSLTTAAVCAGFAYIDGDAVTSVIDSPRGVYPLDRKQLYSGLLGSA